MGTTTQLKPWDFSHCLDFLASTVATSEPKPDAAAFATAAAAANANATGAVNLESHQRNAGVDAKDHATNAALGDFSKVFDFLGTPPLSKDADVPRTGNEPASSIFITKDDYASDGATYVVSQGRPSREQQHSVDDTTDGETLSALGSSAETQEKALTKTQRKKMRRKERKAQEALKKMSLGERPGGVSESEADRTFAKNTPAQKASAHVKGSPAIPGSISAWQSATRILPQKYVSDIAAAAQQRKQGTDKPVPPAEHKFKETFKKTAPDQGPIGGPRKYASTEYTVHDASGSKAVSSHSPQKKKGKDNADASPHDMAQDAPTSEDEDKTHQAVNAVAAAFATIKNGTDPLTATSNISAPRSKSANAPATPTQPRKQQPAQTQPVQKSQNFSTPQQYNRLNLVPSSVQPMLNGKQQVQNYHSASQGMGPGTPSPFAATAAQFVPMPTPKKKKFPPQTIEPMIIRKGEDRHYALLMKLLNTFPAHRGHILSPARTLNHSNDATGIHVFVDASNIFIGFMDQLKQARGIHPLHHLPPAALSFDGLALLMERGRPVAKRVLAGSYPWLPAFDKAKDVGYEMNILEKVYKARELTERQLFFKEQDARRFGNRAKAPPANNMQQTSSSPPVFSVLGNVGSGSGTETYTPQYDKPKNVEQGVDEILHLKMAQSIIDYETPSTIVLATGDAAAAEYSEGFMAMVERALRRGWAVELVSWSKNISKSYSKSMWTQAWDGRFRIIYLDDFAEELLDM